MYKSKFVVFRVLYHGKCTDFVSFAPAGISLIKSLRCEKKKTKWEEKEIFGHKGKEREEKAHSGRIVHKS